MKLTDTLFIGGYWPRLASVNIRCVDIARRLGCEYRVNVCSIDEIPHRYRAFICVKAKLSHEDLDCLARRGVVVWDILDAVPPEHHAVSVYLASTETVRRMLGGRDRRIEVIPHYHCNFEGEPNPLNGTHPGWIGQIHWYPKLQGFEHSVHDISGASRSDVTAAYRGVGIGLNLRAQKPGTELHAQINAGIKLINCIGFGLPSISSREHPYLELGGEYTLFADSLDCAPLVRQLQDDKDLYRELRSNCMARARDFHVDSIARKYRDFIGSL